MQVFKFKIFSARNLLAFLLCQCLMQECLKALGDLKAPGELDLDSFEDPVETLSQATTPSPVTAAQGPSDAASGDDSGAPTPAASTPAPVASASSPATPGLPVAAEGEVAPAPKMTADTQNLLNAHVKAVTGGRATNFSATSAYNQHWAVDNAVNTAIKANQADPTKPLMDPDQVAAARAVIHQQFTATVAAGAHGPVPASHEYGPEDHALLSAYNATLAHQAPGDHEATRAVQDIVTAQKTIRTKPGIRTQEQKDQIKEAKAVLASKGIVLPAAEQSPSAPARAAQPVQVVAEPMTQQKAEAVLTKHGVWFQAKLVPYGASREETLGQTKDFRTVLVHNKMTPLSVLSVDDQNEIAAALTVATPPDFKQKKFGPPLPKEHQEGLKKQIDLNQATREYVNEKGLGFKAYIDQFPLEHQEGIYGKLLAGGKIDEAEHKLNVLPIKTAQTRGLLNSLSAQGGSEPTTGIFGLGNSETTQRAAHFSDLVQGGSLSVEDHAAVQTYLKVYADSGASADEKAIALEGVKKQGIPVPEVDLPKKPGLFSSGRVAQENVAVNHARALATVRSSRHQ